MLTALFVQTIFATHAAHFCKGRHVYSGDADGWTRSMILDLKRNAVAQMSGKFHAAPGAHLCNCYKLN